MVEVVTHLKVVKKPIQFQVVMVLILLIVLVGITPLRKTTLNNGFQVMHTVLGTSAPKRGTCPTPSALGSDGLGPMDLGPDGFGTRPEAWPTAMAA